jgi:hypothetical protein
MVQSTVERLLNFLNRLLDTALSVLPWALVILGVLMVMGIVLYALDKAAFGRARDWFSKRGGNYLVWLPAILAVLFGAFAISVAQRAVNLRFENQQSAQFSKQEDPSGGQTVQFSPNVSFSQDVTYTRSFSLPPDFAKQLGNDPENVLQRYIGFGLSFNGSLKDVQDGFKRERGGVLFTRTYTVEQNNAVALEGADVNVNFDFGDTGAGRSYYRSAFTGKYSFSNPNNAPARMRFTFPLPAGSGTLSDFAMTVNGKPVEQANLDQGYIWEGSVDAGAKLEVSVQYRNQGAKTWSYQFGTRREPIKNFKLRVNSPRSVSYLRGSLYPTNQTGALEWQLKNIITSQSVVIAFPELSLRETLKKLFVFAPAALGLALLWALLYGWQRAQLLEPMRFALAALGIALGFGAMGILLGYLPTGLALWIGAIIAAVLGTLALGIPFALPVVISSLSPLAFLSGGNAGLWLFIAGLIVIASLLPTDTVQHLRNMGRRTP